MGRAAVAITLSEAERRELEGFARRRKTAQGLARRARIVLAASEGLENKAIVERLGADANTVGKWRRRFAERRLDGLYDEPRSGAPRKIGDEQIVEIFGRTLEETPPDGTHWSLRSMARAVGYAPSTIHRMWQAFGLQPHRSETFKLSSDPQPVCVRSTVRLQGPFEDGATIDVFEGPGRAVLGPLWGRGNLRGITGIQ